MSGTRCMRRPGHALRSAPFAVFSGGAIEDISGVCARTVSLVMITYYSLFITLAFTEAAVPRFPLKLYPDQPEAMQ